MAAAGHRFSSGGRHHARLVRAVRRVLPMQLASTAHRSQPIPANVPPAGGLHNPVHPGMAEIRHPSQRRVHEYHRIIGRARHFRCDRHCVRHQTYSMAYAIVDSHRFLLVLLQRGCGARAYPSICISSRWPAISRTSCTGSTSMKARCGVVVARSSCSLSPAISACICSAYCCRLCGLCVGATVSIAKRLRNLIVVYAIGSVMMQAGTRIVLRANLPES